MCIFIVQCLCPSLHSKYIYNTLRARQSISYVYSFLKSSLTTFLTHPVHIINYERDVSFYEIMDVFLCIFQCILNIVKTPDGSSNSGDLERVVCCQRKFVWSGEVYIILLFLCVTHSTPYCCQNNRVVRAIFVTTFFTYQSMFLLLLDQKYRTRSQGTILIINNLVSMYSTFKGIMYSV